MRRIAAAVLVATLTGAAQAPPAQSRAQVPERASGGETEVVLPARTVVPLALTRPLRAWKTAPGMRITAETVFPVDFNNQIVIPAGTYVEGQIDALTRPGRLSPHAEFKIHFTKIIFGNGYVVELPRAHTAQTPATRFGDVLAAVATPWVAVTAQNDVLLDIGSQIEMMLQAPLSFRAARVAEAVRRSRFSGVVRFRSTTTCVPAAGTPGTPDTVIPGSSGSPGTPDIVIQGLGGMPDTVIPGTPATPATPDTVIWRGDPGTAAVVCPNPGLVIRNPQVQNYTEPFQLDAPAQVSGTTLPAGSYQATWKGTSGAAVQVDIRQRKTMLVTVAARFVLLAGKAPATAAQTAGNRDGTVALRSLRFAGQAFALYFDGGAP